MLLWDKYFRNKMRFVGVFTTSNGRQFDKYARINHRGTYDIYHTPLHTCCCLGEDIEKVEEYANNILNIKIASFPGLKLSNINSKVCYAGPYENLTVAGYLSQICGEDDFSGTLASVMLCNDDKHINGQENAQVKVKLYLKKLEDLFKNVTGFSNVKYIILNTALHRQSDFHWKFNSYLEKKKRFNCSLVENANTRGFKLIVGGRIIPYSVVNMGDFMPVNDMRDQKYYCKNEKPGAKIHIRGIYMEKYLLEVRRLHQIFANKGRRRAIRDPFFMLSKIDIS
jgi:hypothetical protein